MREIFLIQLGLGNVGGALVRQLLAQEQYLARRYGLRLRYLALVDSQGAFTPDQNDANNAWVVSTLLLKEDGLPLSRTLPAERWPELLPDWPCIVVDTTAAPAMEDRLAAAVLAGQRVVLANKRPLCADLSRFQELTGCGATRYEATVGAGLPVIATLQSLLDSGDELLRVEACLSGTLGFLCSQLDAGAAFSDAVVQARERGYTEPDPRDDLDGGDVGRKALILARTAGLAWATAPVTAQPLFPSHFAALDVPAFLQALPDLDAEYAMRQHAAQVQGQVLRYVATITPQGAEVALTPLPLEHPLAALRGPDNLIAFTTTRYHERPLIVRGPGAGADVTAAGVLGDIVATARELA